MANWGEKFNKVTQSAINKSKEVAEVTRLNMEISTFNQNIKDLYFKAGEYVLESGLTFENAVLKGYYEQLETIRQNIADTQEKIREAKNITICPKCGAEVPRTSRFCDKCGTELIQSSEEEAVNLCKNCGNPLEKDALFCGNCGTKQE